MQGLRTFHRVFLFVPADSGFALRLLVCPDSGQRRARTEPTAIISSRSADLLSLCVTELGVTGYARWLGEKADVPMFSYRECAAAEIVAQLTSRPLSLLAQVTLIAADTSIGEMRRRVASLRKKAGDSLDIYEST
jgi:hypothetical protein